MRRLGFEDQHRVFGNEVNGATQLFYSYLALRSAMAENEDVENLLNVAPTFWRTTLHALQLSTFIFLNRIFDQDPKSRHNLDKMLSAAQSEIDIFSRDALAKRKQGTAAQKPDWVDEYVAKAHIPTQDDFRSLRKQASKWRKIYEAKYRPIRNQIYAHTSLSTEEEHEELWKQTRIQELQRMLRFLRQLDEALWEMLHNGCRPTIRTQRFSVGRMRRIPRPGRHHVHERVTREVETFLDACTNALYKIPAGKRNTRSRRPKTA